MSRDLLVARRWWLVPAGVALGAVVGLIVSLAGSTSRRAEAEVLVTSPRGPAAVTPMLPNVEALATSSVLAGNVRSTLRLGESAESVRRRLGATIRPHSQVIVISATQAHPDRARQVADEAAAVFVQLVEARFAAGTPPLHASRMDQAHVLGAPSRHVVRNPLLGAGIGLVVGAVGALLLGGGVGTAIGPDDATASARRELRKREQLLDERIKAVGARERELARRVGELAARERAFDARAAEPPPAPEPEPAAPAAVPPEPEPTAGGPAVLADADPSRANINALERLVAEHEGATPEQREDWQAYLFFLRDHAAVDGSLPAQFDGLLAEVFGELFR
jgi:hypothetical protein